MCSRGENTYADILNDLKGTGKLYDDPDFTPESAYENSHSYRKIEWKRPKDISQNPKLFEDGACRFDVRQGELGDCWLLAAISSLTAYPTLLHKVVPPTGQDFRDNYVGAFHFNIWQYGKWTEVVVDDRLPTMQGTLCFMASKSEDEFWSALLEKAYAKLCGSYEALIKGLQAESMEDLTGGLCEVISLDENVPDDLYKQMSHNITKCCLMGCFIKVGDGSAVESKAGHGLIAGHAYSITDVKELNDSTKLVRIRNPWGDHIEWTGPWGDSSAEWGNISEQQRKELGLVFEDDGEFW